MCRTLIPLAQSWVNLSLAAQQLWFCCDYLPVLACYGFIEIRHMLFCLCQGGAWPTHSLLLQWLCSGWRTTTESLRSCVPLVKLVLVM